MAQSEPGAVVVRQPDEGESYWQPVPANGYSEVRVSKRDSEKIQGFSDPPVSRCPECEGRVSKLLSQCTFHLKGSGWYATDYAKDQDTSGLKYNNNKKKVEKKTEKAKN